MNKKKYVVLCIILSLLMPCKIILGQNVESDTAVQSELDIKYDSVLGKAAAALTASAYQQSIDYYKEASALKPGESYAYKMINYVQDLAVKQKRADDLKRKAQIKDDLTKANQSIADKKWDSAKILFNRVLALKPEKADEEFAKSKVEAIDLELQRIALRTPVKEEPKPVYVPKNRSEARAFRKLAERNAMLASTAGKKPPTPAAIPSPAKNVAVATSAPKTNPVPQKPLQSPTISAAKVTPPVTKEIPNKPTQATLPEKKVANTIDSPAATGIQQKPTQTPVQQMTQKPAQTPPATNQTVVSPPAKVMAQIPAEIPASVRNNGVAPAAKQTQQAPLPANNRAAAVPPVTKQIQQAPLPVNNKVVAAPPPATKETQQATLPANNRAAVAPPVTKQIQQAPLPVNNRVVAAPPPATKETQQATLPVTNRVVTAAPPAAKETQPKAIQTPSPSNSAAYPAGRETQQTPAQAQSPTLPDNAITAPSTEAMPQKTNEGNLLKLSDSSDYVKLICQDISFIGSNAYIKVLIQNYSPTTEFLTDTLHVSIKKNNGIIKELNQRFISNFPIIMPLKESVLVSFADAAMNIAPDDIFIVEMRDKMRKTKLVVQVPWSLYNQQKAF